MVSEREANERIGRLISRWRSEAGFTQTELGEKIGLSRRQIQNMESGEANFKYYHLMLIAEACGKDIGVRLIDIDEIWKSDDEKTLYYGLKQRIKRFSTDMIKAIHFIFYVNHGSDLRAFTQLCVAYLNLPMRDKQRIAGNIISDYENAAHIGELTCPNEYQPDMHLIKEAQEKGRKAYLKNEPTYIVRKDELNE